MSNKPNFWKLIMGVVVLSIFVIATWAATSTRLTSAQVEAVHRQHCDQQLNRIV